CALPIFTTWLIVLATWLTWSFRRSFRTFRTHRQIHAVTFSIHIQNTDLYDLTRFHHFMRISDKFIGKFRNMHQSVLMYTHIDKSTKVSDVGHYTFKLHAFRQLRNFSNVITEDRKSSCRER